MRWLLITALLLTPAVAGCVSLEELPTIEETLPVGYAEKPVPQDLYEDLAADLIREDGWIRCFDTEIGWQGLQDHVGRALAPRSYTNSTAQKVQFMISDSGIPAEHAEKIFCFFSAPSNQAHVMLVNLEYLRSVTRADIGTTGDFLVMVGRGRIGST